MMMLTLIMMVMIVMMVINMMVLMVIMMVTIVMMVTPRFTRAHGKCAIRETTTVMARQTMASWGQGRAARLRTVLRSWPTTAAPLMETMSWTRGRTTAT